MSDDEKFCHCICDAARKMGIYARIDVEGATKRVTFFDVMARSTISGPYVADQNEALKLACEKLVDYFTIKP